MFKNYTIQILDTAQKIARKELGDPSKANEIIKINGMLPDENEILIPGIIIKIPDSKPDDLSSPIDFDTDTGGLKSLSLSIGDNNLELFDNFQYVESLTGIRAGGFSCDYDPLNNKIHRDSFKFGKSFKIIANNKKLITGYTMTPAPIYSKDFTGITMLFKSAIHMMLRSDIAPNNFPLEFSPGQTLEQISQRICDMFNIKLTIDSNVSNIVLDDGDSSGVAIGVTENAFAFLVRICQSRGVLIKDNADGGLIIFRPILKPPITSFIDGLTEGIDSISVSYNYETLAKSYNLFSQYGNNAIFGNAENSLLPLNIFKNFDAPSVSAGIAENIAKWKMLREVSAMVKIIIPIGDWYTPEKKRYEAGDFIDIESPQNGIFERRTLIIESVNSVLNKDSYGGTLTCTIPEAYTGDNINWLPMI